jgi:hypothetical protein
MFQNMRSSQSTRRALAAARKIVSAKRQLATARRSLAEATAPGHADVIVAPGWARAKQALMRRQHKLLAIPGVVGVGLGHRRRDGALVSEKPCIVVYVSRKVSLETLARRRMPKIPRAVRSRDGPMVPTDVVAFGSLRRHVLAGTGLGPAKHNEMGTIGSFAVDLNTGEPVALTAMHVTGVDECPPGPQIGIVCPSRIEGNAHPFGVLLAGTMTGVDAAKLGLLSPSSASMAIRQIGVIRGWRPLSEPGDRGTAVRMFGARTGHEVVGQIVEPSVSLPKFGLDAAILVDIESTNGDSGAAIVDNQHLVLGLLVGASSQLNGLRVFTPISRVLARLGCNIPTAT